MRVVTFVRNDNVVSWVASVDVAAMPIQAHKQSYDRSTPNKMFEAFAAGVPMVTSDSPGCRQAAVERWNWETESTRLIELDQRLGPRG